ncbi:gluconate:H+ symporter [Gilvimarinus chinensis]|uniref:gluconate:H+ symporter n=1 Tax=Gilvimarinus chinensis TaxID=396005 RepID=UPI00037E9B97|nr:gluconate:H+ symporter [Gilvimarinus chinensis]
MDIFAVLLVIALLVGLITLGKLHPFLAFLITSLVGGMLLGIPLAQIPGSIETGIGNTLSGLVIIICVGAMFGKLVAETGAAQRIADVLMKAFGRKRITWALMLTGFIVGIPLFYNVGFVLLVPLVFSVMYQSKLPAVYLGIPLLAALSVTHGFLPPHPSPTAMVPMFNASISTTLIYGLIVAIPTMIVAGPLFANYLKRIPSQPLKSFTPKDIPDAQLPGKTNAFITALLPVAFIAGSSFLPSLAAEDTTLRGLFELISNPSVVMLVTLGIATWTLGLAQGHSMTKLMEHYAEAIRDISVIMLIVAGAGALKQVFIDSGVSDQIAAVLQDVALNPLLLGWLIATVIRICLGSATVAGLTAAGIMAPVVAVTGADPNLMILAVGAGSLMCSHVNDSGFWMFKEYFNLSLKDTLKSWTVMESIVGVMGLISVLLIDTLI